MNLMFKQVREFQEAFQQPEFEFFCQVPSKIIDTRAKLIDEELEELYSAIEPIDELDGICDSLYVIIGTMITFGINVGNYNNYRAKVKALPIVDLIEELERIGGLLSIELSLAVPCPNVVPTYLNQLLVLLEEYAIHKNYKLESAFTAVHENNMGKLWSKPSDNPEYISKEVSTGKYMVLNKDGKIMKPEGHRKVNLAQYV